MRLRTIFLTLLAAFTLIAFTGCGNWVDRLLGILDDGVPSTTTVDCDVLAIPTWQDSVWSTMRGPQWVDTTALRNPFIHTYEVITRTGERAEWRFAQANGRWYGQTGYRGSWFKVPNFLIMRTINQDSTVLEQTKELVRRAHGEAIRVVAINNTAPYYEVQFQFYCYGLPFQMRSTMPYLYLLDLLYSQPEVSTPMIERIVPIAWG
jgi:hypothetical protein